MATTTNFGWETPDDTDLVKDGALAIRTLGSAIDTSLVDLKGGTTGQVLSKTSNTDMDFTWVTSDDANAIQNAIVDAKGDLITATAADTPARLAVGTNGQVLTADSTTATGLKWAAASSGSMTLLSTTTLSTTTTTVSSISQSYKHLYIEILGIDTSNFNPTIVYGTNSNAVVFNVTQAAAATGVNYYNTGGTVGNAQNYGGSQPVNKAAIWLYDYTDATNRKVGSFNQYWINEGGAPIYFNGQFVTGHTAAMNAFYMTVSTGSYDAGTIKIYGVN